MIIDVKPEFGYEIACSIPYAYWLQKRGELEKVITCKGMKPFYYFCDNVEEKYEQRSVNNSINGVQNLPNCWIHHNTHVFFEDKTYGDLTEKEKDEVLIRELVSYFDRNNFNVVYRKYVMKYDYWLIDLNVTVNVEMGYVQNQLVPFNIHYNGFWDIPFIKPEIADFTLTNYDFEIIE